MMMMDAAQYQLPLRRRRPVEARRRSPVEICWTFLWCMVVLMLLILLVGGVICFVVVDQTAADHQVLPRYSVAIDSVSGLDLVLAGRLDPQFNLTVRVASRGFRRNECAEPAMHVDVSYHGVFLASSVISTEKICAGTNKPVDQHVVATRANLDVPGSMLDRLAEDLHNGVLVFDVGLRHSSTKHANYICGPRRVGDAYALRKDCVPAVDLVTVNMDRREYYFAPQFFNLQAYL